MNRPESLTEQAVRVLADLATMTDDVTNEHPERHMVRNLKRQAEAMLGQTLNTIESLITLKEEVRDIVREFSPPESDA